LSNQLPTLEPIRSAYRIQYFTDKQLKQLQQATLEIMETIGVRFPSKKALEVLDGHGAKVDKATENVKIPRDLVFKAMQSVPRYFLLGARVPEYDLSLQDGTTYFTTDGCGVQVIDLETGQERASRKADVGMMAHVIDAMPAFGFYWPMVSAQDYGRTSILHEIDASWNNTVKHVQSETIMGKRECQFAVEMATVIAGNKEEVRKRPPLSLVVCTIAPLVQDHAGIEGAMVMAEAGIPVGFLAMPTLGTTAPATLAGALAMGDAEIISACVLMQLVAPGAPVFHSLMQAWADPRTGGYISYPRDARGRYGVVEMAHHWGMPSLGACFGTDSIETGTWQSAAEPALDPLLAGLTSPEIVTGMGLSRTYTRLYPEQVILDEDLYQRARAYLQRPEINEEALALDSIANVGPGGHFLTQKHTRTHMPTSFVRGVTHELDQENKFRDPREVARERVRSILKNHQPEPLEKAKQDELTRILASAEKELG
jgi:trimethylamine---corrinoid protein Co-methyltransferase